MMTFKGISAISFFSEIITESPRSLSNPQNPQSQIRDPYSETLTFFKDRIDEGSWNELISISEETNPDIYFESLYQFGVNQEQRGQIENATTVYSLLTQDSRELAVPPSLQQRAKERLDAIKGIGDFGRRLDFLGRRFVADTLNPLFLGTMAGTQLIAGAGKLAIASRLSELPATHFLSHPLLVHLLSSLGAFGLEVPTYVGLDHGLRKMFGLSGTEESLADELKTTAINLGSLKFTNFLGNTLAQDIGKVGVPDFFSSLSQKLIPHVTLLGGIYLGKLAEMRYVLHTQKDGATTLCDSLVTFFQFKSADNLSQGVLGERFEQFSRNLHLHTEELLTSRLKYLTTSFMSSVFSPHHSMMAAGTNGELFPTTVHMAAMSMPAGERISEIPRSRRKTAREPRPIFPEKNAQRAATIWQRFLKDLPLSTEVSPGKLRVQFEGNSKAVLYETMKSVLGNIPNGKTLAIIEVTGNNVAFGKESFQRNLGPLLESHPTLEEIRVVQPHGFITSISKTEGKIAFGIENVSLSNILLRGEDHAAEEVHFINLVPDWKQYQGLPRLQNYLIQIREKAGWTPWEVARRLKEDPTLVKELEFYKMKDILPRHIHKYENKGAPPMPFPLLRRYAEIFGEDINKLIVISNETHFTKTSRMHWSTVEYPIYLESAADVNRIEYYRQAPKHNSFGSYGWLIFVSRKNPYRYLQGKTLAMKLGLGENILCRIEINTNPPLNKTLQGLATHLHLNHNVIIDAVNATFHHTLPLQTLFPGQSIHLQPGSRDEEKVLEYEKKPGTKGQFLFAYRKTLPDLPNAEEFSTMALKRNDDYWNSREQNRIVISPDLLSDWIQLFHGQALPLELLHALAEGQDGLSSRRAVWKLAEAMIGKSFEQVANEATLNPVTIGYIVHGSGPIPKPATLLALREALPGFDASLLYRRYYPLIDKFFPEAKEGKLFLTPDHIRNALEVFHLGESIYSFRMAPPPSAISFLNKDGTINLESVGDLIGVKKNTVLDYESIFKIVEKDITLDRLAIILEVDRRVLYLCFRPDILRIFTIINPTDGSKITPTPKEVTRLRRRSSVFFDRENLRRKLSPFIIQSPQAVVKDNSEIDFVATLENMLGVSRGLAEKYLNRSAYLSPSEIKTLTDRIPALSYHKWYEHFNRSILAFFLGKKPDGSINYDLPAGYSRFDLIPSVIRRLILQAIPKHFASGKEAVKVLRGSSLGDLHLFNKSLNERSWDNRTIIHIANRLGIDKRLLFLYFRENELNPMLEAQNPPPPPDTTTPSPE